MRSRAVHPTPSLSMVNLRSEKHLQQTSLLRTPARICLTESVLQVVKSISTQIFQLMHHASDCKEQVDEVVGELTFAKRLVKHFV